MEFIKHIMLRVALFLTIILGVWATLFFYTIVDEVNDETDDVLEDFSAMIIQNFLAGEPMPINDNGSNNTYHLRPVATDSITLIKEIEGFCNEDVYLKSKNEYEPARVLRQLFRDKDDNYYEVTVLTPTIDNKDLIDAIWQSIAVLFVLLLITVIIINAVAIHSSLLPLRKFMTWLNSSDIETCELPTVEKSDIKEIKKLTAAIEAFAQRGKRAFEEQKDFIGNASHELQTPIAICQNRLELLCNSDLNEQQMKDVAHCLSTLARLSKLNKSLLMLSKIENGGFDNDKVDINELVRRNTEIITDLYEYRNISLNVTHLNDCIIEINSGLAATLILNLIKNSYVHNIDGGKVNVEIDSDSITISNSGAEKALDSNKIFSRFYQGGSKSGTYGLGLPIIQSICKLYNFKLCYSFAESMHQFKIKFK